MFCWISGDFFTFKEMKMLKNITKNELFNNILLNNYIIALQKIYN